MCLSSFRVCEIPGYTHAHARTETFEKRARGEGGGGRLGFAPNCRNPNRARFWNFRRARHSIECSLSILTRVESASVRRRPPSWKRSPRAPFFIIGVSSMWLLTFRAGMIFDYSYSVEKKKYFLFFFLNRRGFNVILISCNFMTIGIYIYCDFVVCFKMIWNSEEIWMLEEVRTIEW